MDKQKEIESWSKRYGRQISEKEYDDICQNLSNVFTTLRGWEKEEQNKEKINESP